MKEIKLWTGQYIAIVLMAFLFFMSLQLLTAGFPAFILELKQNPTQGGLMTTVFMLAAIVTRPFVGFLMHRINVKKMSMITLIFVSITLTIGYNQESVGFLLLLRVFHGIGFGIMTTVLATLATNIIPKKRLGEGVGYYSLATSVATSMAPMFALALLAYLPFNLLLIISIIFAVATFFFSFLIKSPQIPVSNQTNVKKLPFKESLFDKKAFIPSICCAFFSITLGGVVSFLRELGKEENLGGSTSLFFLVVAIIMLISRPISGKLYDRFGHKIIIYPASICGMISMFLLSITHSTTILLIAGFFYGIAYGTITPTLQALAVSLVSKEKQGTANAMYFSSMDLGMAIGSTGLGFLASMTGYHFIYGCSIISIALLLVVYTLQGLKVKKKKRETITATASSM